MSRKQPRVEDPCGSVHEEPADYRHLCQLPAGHPGPHQCWSADEVRWS